MTVIVLGVLALLISLAALAIAVLSARAVRERRPTDDGSDLPTDVLGLRQEVAGLRLDSADALRHLSVVRYDAFTDMGGKLSWSVALLDDHGNGVVLTSIHGRSDARTYAKSISDWSCAQPLSPEEQDAVTHARP
ncbi:MAG TPA: DUF4446 family protein [Marmoricola sp.]